MKILILLLVISNVYAKNKNIFFDAKIDLPIVGEGIYKDNFGSSETQYSTPKVFLGISLGYSVQFSDEWIFEPSVGYSFNSGNSSSLVGGGYIYDYADITLPIMYSKKGFKGGLFFKYIDIPSIEWGSQENGDYIEFKDKNAYTLGIKIVTRSWFYSYEYLLNGKYLTGKGQAKIDIEGSRISIGLRKTF